MFIASSLECGFHCVVLKGRSVPVLTKLAQARTPGSAAQMPSLCCGSSVATEKVIRSAAFASRVGWGGETVFLCPPSGQPEESADSLPDGPGVCFEGFSVTPLVFNQRTL